ncbi:hypothetical protein DM02DRAFT_623365 [Periconia macrospinosa]|uniref:Brl1/Brr6 domain-containing protein n=1 Tax=Periconia macrospinosa TaxID=97972 RepID=A0A2V1E675_9PLEO|nr:hypothetical protein DM02DRAFT_623365 [Periconia macrospinosa]
MSRHRPSTTPMDFEWENETGQVDSSSPWITSHQSFAKKRKLSSFASDPIPIHTAQHLTRSLPEGPSGTHSVLDSPSKHPFSTPNRPQLREPNGQHYLFSEQRPFSSIPSHVQNSGAWEPRTPQSVIDFSSGGETPNTPAQDSDVATPDTHLASKMGSLSHGDKKSPRKTRRESIMSFFGRSSPSPSKDESSSRKGYSKKAENRVMKRRSKKQKNATVEDFDDSETDQGRTKNIRAGGPKSASGGVFAGAIANIPGVLHWVEAHPNLPAVLSYYMQFLVNTILGLSFLYIFYSVICAVYNDVNIEANSRATTIMHEIAVCAKHFRDNGCNLTKIPPALQQPCMQWDTCMNQDVKKIAHASVGMTAIAKIINAFTEEFSYKSMIFMAMVLFGGFNLSNWAFNRIRNDQNYHHPSQQFDYAPPATPQRQISGGPGYMMDGGQGAWQTPYGTPYASIQRPALQHASQSLPALPSSNTVAGAEEPDRATVRGKKGIFRR